VCRCPRLYVLIMTAVQDVARDIGQLQRQINEQSCNLFLVDGTIVSIDDWKWTCSAKDVPFTSKAPKGVAWCAENAVTLPHKFVLCTRKRVRDAVTKKIETCAKTMMEVAAFLKSFNCRDVSITVDRGFANETVAQRCTLPADMLARRAVAHTCGVQ